MYYLKGQKRFNDCGVACVGTILGLYGIHYNYKSLGNVNTFLDILVLLEYYKIDCKAVYIEDINVFPCIAQIKRFNHYHFIVIYKEIGEKYLYYSPNKLLIHKIKKKRIKKFYTKRAILIYKNEPFCNYKICINSLPFGLKIILFDIFLIILIISLLRSSVFVL